MHHASWITGVTFFEIAVYAYVRIRIHVCVYNHTHMCVWSYAYVRIKRVCAVNVYLSGTVHVHVQPATLSLCCLFLGIVLLNVC